MTLVQSDWTGETYTVPVVANPKGTVTLNGVTPVAVSVPSLTAGSIVLVTIQVVAGLLGVVAVSSVTPGVGFSLLTVALGTSVVGWEVLLA